MKVSELIKKISDKDVDMLMTGAECEFVGSCAYFLKVLKGDTVEMDIKINPLVRDEYINRMQDLGVVMDRKKGYYNESYFCRPMNKIMSYTINKTVSDWTFDIYDNLLENSHVQHSSGSGYIPLVAYFAVSKIINNISGQLHLISKVEGPSTYINLIILKSYGNKIVENLVVIENCNIGQADWIAYVQMQKQFGHMISTSDSIEKKKWLVDNDVKPGDIMLLYEIGKGNNISNRELIGCHMVVIKSYDNMTISYEYIGTTEMLLTQVERVSQTEFMQKNKKEYEEFYKECRSMSYISVGIEYLTCEEDYMLMLPTPDDISCQLMILPSENNGEWELRHVVLDTLETIYAVLENRGINYNKQRFLNKYFKNKVPYYERFRAHQPTQYEDLSNEELIKKYGEDAK